jgi:hypothetical protein
MGTAPVTAETTIVCLAGLVAFTFFRLAQRAERS